MLAEYLERLYLPAVRDYRDRCAHDLKLARELHGWLGELRRHWSAVHWGKVEVDSRDGAHAFRVQVYLGEVAPEAVAVELYAEPREGTAPGRHVLRRDHALSGAAGGFLYVGSVPASRPAGDYTPRLVPSHPGAQIPAEAPYIRWHGA
jgi:starch phosphorylase